MFRQKHIASFCPYGGFGLTAVLAQATTATTAIQQQEIIICLAWQAPLTLVHVRVVCCVVCVVCAVVFVRNVSPLVSYFTRWSHCKSFAALQNGGPRHQPGPCKLQNQYKWHHGLLKVARNNMRC